MWELVEGPLGVLLHLIPSCPHTTTPHLVSSTYGTPLQPLLPAGNRGGDCDGPVGAGQGPLGCISPVLARPAVDPHSPDEGSQQGILRCKNGSRRPEALPASS